MLPDSGLFRRRCGIGDVGRNPSCLFLNVRFAERKDRFLPRAAQQSGNRLQGGTFLEPPGPSSAYGRACHGNELDVEPYGGGALDDLQPVAVYLEHERIVLLRRIAREKACHRRYGNVERLSHFHVRDGAEILVSVKEMLFPRAAGRGPRDDQKKRYDQRPHGATKLSHPRP